MMAQEVVYKLLRKYDPTEYNLAETIYRNAGHFQAHGNE